MEFPELATTPKTMQGTFKLDLGPMGLQPKDVVTFQLESRDNNTLTGPGTGKSAPIVLRVASLEDKHMRAIEAQQEVLEQLLGVLGSFLEAPVGTREPNAKNIYEQDVPEDITGSEKSERFRKIKTAHSELADVLLLMTGVADLLKQDPLTLERDLAIFSALVDQLYAEHRDGNEVLVSLESRANAEKLSTSELQRVANYAARMENTLEKGLLQLEDLLATQKMEAIQETAKEIRALKDRLKELLLKYKETRDPSSRRPSCVKSNDFGPA